MAKRSIRTCVTLEPSLYMRLKQFCYVHYRTSRSGVISEAVEQFLDNEESNEKEASKSSKKDK